MVFKSEYLNLLKPPRPVQACTEIAWHLIYAKSPAEFTRYQTVLNRCRVLKSDRLEFMNIFSAIEIAILCSVDLLLYVY
jgi:hypothetical protein